MIKLAVAEVTHLNRHSEAVASMCGVARGMEVGWGIRRGDSREGSRWGWGSGCGWKGQRVGGASCSSDDGFLHFHANMEARQQADAADAFEQSRWAIVTPVSARSARRIRRDAVSTWNLF